MSSRRGRFVEAVSTRQYEYAPHERARMLGEIARRKRTADRNRRVAAVAGALLTIAAASWVLRSPKPVVPSVEAPRVGLLADGSRVTADEGASWVVHEVTAARVHLEVPAGRVRFEVSKRPERDFVVTARDLAVIVVGTVFTVDVTNAGVRVDVEEGRVRVRRADGSEKVLVVGETLTVAAEAPANEAPAAQVAPSLEVRRPTKGPSTAPPPEPKLGPELVTHVSPTTFAEVIAEGDAALARGEPERAVRSWSEAIDRFPSEPGRAVVAFRRARVMLQSLKDPAGAAEAFSQLEALGAAAPLVEDALAREVEAWAAAKNVERARQRAADFVARYPNSYRRAAVERAAGLVP